MPKPVYRRFLSRQLNAIFVALKLQLQNRTCKPGAIFSAICRRDMARVSSMFETCLTLARQKLHRVAAKKIPFLEGLELKKRPPNSGKLMPFENKQRNAAQASQVT